MNIAAEIIITAAKIILYVFFIFFTDFVNKYVYSSRQLVQKVSGTKVSKKTSGPSGVLVRFVNLLTDICQHRIDICQSIYTKENEEMALGA
jgi:hypothetical protein